MAGLKLILTIEDEPLQQRLRETEAGLEHLVTLVAEDMEKSVRLEGGMVGAGTLGEPWEITGVGGTERHVVAPVWWAQFVAHGTSAHGPARASKLHFFIGDAELFVDFVQGEPSNPFDERAIEKTKSHLGEILGRAIP